MRNSKIDILRFIGLSVIIFSHVGSYGVLFQVRNFDVPLMVLVSGMSFGLSYKVNEKYFSYLWKRIKRLVFPVWIFLTIYFVTIFFVDINNNDLTIKTVLTSYLLISGIGYVWIIKVFLLVAMVSPLIFTFNSKTTSNKSYFLFLALIYALYEILRFLSLPYIESGTPKALSLITHYIIPYGVIFAIGLRMPLLTTLQVKKLSAFSLIVFIFIGILLYMLMDYIVPTQAYKYPPSLYYFSYALFISTMLWLYSDKIEVLISKVRLTSLIAFMAKNSIWIYLWHIPVVKYFDAHFIIKFVVVIALSTIFTFTQIVIIKKIMSYIKNENLRKNIKILFTG